MEKQRRRRVHGEATECVVFMGRQWNASRSSGGLGRNRRWKRGLAYRTTEEMDLLHSEWGPVDREGSGVPQNGRNRPPMVETGVLLIGRGVAYRKTEETDLLRSKRGSCSSGGVWRTAKRDSTGYCSSPPSTSSSLHGLPSTSYSLNGLLFIQPPPRATPPATVQPPLHGHPSTIYCSSSPPHHRVLFNHPSTATPPPSTIHPALHTMGSCSSRGNATAHCSSNSPPHTHTQRSLFIQSIGFS